MACGDPYYYSQGKRSGTTKYQYPTLSTLTPLLPSEQFEEIKKLFTTSNNLTFINPQTMNTQKLFMYVVVLNPTAKEQEDGIRPKVISKLEVMFADNDAQVRVKAAMDIPEEYRNKQEQIEILVRNF